MSRRDDNADRIAEEVSESLNRALAGLDLRALGGGRPEPRFGKKRTTKPRQRPATTDIPGQMRLPFDGEVQK